MNSLISVIIPLYNTERYVAETIKSIVDQTYTNWELIIVDDGSTDNSLKIAKQYQSDKIQVYSQKNRGASAARNLGYSISKGDYIKFLDSDDLISDNMLEQQLLNLKDHPNCIASAQWGRFYNNDLSTFKLNPEDCWQDLPSVNWICSSWKNSQPMLQPGIFLFPRNILEISGLWNESLTLIDDFEFCTRTILSSNAVKFTQNAILKYRSGLQNTLSARKSKSAVESAILSARLATDNLLSHLNTIESRNICANCLMTLVYDFGLEYPHLISPVEVRVIELGGSSLSFPGGKMFKLISKLLGWKAAKIIKNKFQNIYGFFRS